MHARAGASAPRWLLWTFAGFTFSGWIATLAGWIVTEMGRQPWLVTGLLRTRRAVGDISGAQLGASLTAYILTYSGMLIAYMVVLTHLAGEGAGDWRPGPPARHVPAGSGLAMDLAADLHVPDGRSRSSSTWCSTATTSAWAC